MFSRAYADRKIWRAGWTCPVNDTKESLVNRLLIVSALVVTALVGAGAALAGNGNGATVVRGDAFYANGDLFRTVATPNDLSGTGAPDSSYDTLFMFAGAQMPLSSAAPGAPGYNGGRWMVRPVSFTVSYASAVATYGGGNGVFDSYSELHAAIAAGAASVGSVMSQFSCPVIPTH